MSAIFCSLVFVCVCLWVSVVLCAFVRLCLECVVWDVFEILCVFLSRCVRVMEAGGGGGGVVVFVTERTEGEVV